MRRDGLGASLLPPFMAVLAGGAQALSLAAPGSGEPLWWLQVASLVLLAHLLLTAPDARSAGLRGWGFATAWLAGTFWWLFVSMHTYGGLAAPLAVAAVLALALFLGSYYALACGYFHRVRPARRAFAATLFGALWLLAELARGQWWTGFPWGASGYAHVNGPLSVLAPSVGVYGIGAVAAVLAMGVAQWRADDLRRVRWWLGVVLLALLWAGLALQRERSLQRVTVHLPLTLALLQGNIPQDEKFQPGSGVPLALDWYGTELRQASARLVVAPETAIPMLPQELAPGYLDRATARYVAGNQALLLGIPLGDAARGYTNSVWGFAPGLARPYEYDKHHLVPFGEFIPPLFRWFTEMLHIPLGDFNRGALGQPSLDWAGERIAPNICYEDLFGEELAVHFSDGASAPTILVNLSNIGWFGDTPAVAQHLAISRMRALELQRPMVRATNTGATAVIDERGRVTARLAPFTRAVLYAEVRGVEGAVTPYAWWASRWGLVPLWILGLAVALLAFMWRPRRDNG